MVPGYIYVLESNEDNVSWVPTVDNIVLGALYTEGEEYVKLQIPQDFKVKGKTGIVVVDSGGGHSYDDRPNKRAYAVLANGIETTIANGMQVANFFMLDRHCSGAEAVFKRYYLVIRLFDGTYVPFIDQNSDPQDYCKGVVLDWEVDWDEGDNQRVTVRLNWRSVWRDGI